MEESILNDIKHMLGIIDPEYVIFDPDITAHINAAIGVLNQIGIGVEGFFLTDSSQSWNDLLGEDRTGFKMVKQYIFFKTKIAFDPPVSSFVLDSYKNIVQELEYRMNVLHEIHNKEEEP